MVIGLSGVQFGLKHTSDYQNQTTTKWESDLLIMSMIADRWQWSPVTNDMKSCYQSTINITISKKTKIHLHPQTFWKEMISKVNTSSILEILQIFLG